MKKLNSIKINVFYNLGKKKNKDGIRKYETIKKKILMFFF